MPIRVFLADDHALVRAGVQRLAQPEHDIEIVGEVEDGDHLLLALDKTDVDVLVVDISMPGKPFLELLATLRARWPRLRVLVMTMYPEEQFAIRALQKGAFGYLNKAESPTELLKAIRKVHIGEHYVSPALTEHLASWLDERATAKPHEQLSTREHEVFRLLAAGRAVKQIAADLGVSRKTVSTYRARLMEKMGLSSTPELMRYALEHGVLTPTVRHND